MSKPYEKLIIEEIGCAPEDASIIEDLMRTQVFHSTLDWQSREQLRQGAIEALELLNADREFLEGYYRNMRAFVESKIAESKTQERVACYEI